MSVLVTGGAGYIGSVLVEELAAQGEDVVVLDNLVRGFRSNVANSTPFYEGCISDTDQIGHIVKKHDVTSCIHLAAYAYISESVADPGKYFRNNVARSIKLLDSLTKNGVGKFVFSSSCATYGEPEYLPIDENHPQKPINPYGWSKLMFEEILKSYSTAHELDFVALRYFNAAGATERLGEMHDPETHLIPLTLKVASGSLEKISILGDSYPTKDGTAIRDYIHVSDLSRAHILALRYLKGGGKSEFINLGNGGGYSVKEVIDIAGKTTGRAIKTEIKPPRVGDPSCLVSSANKAEKLLGWKPEFTQLDKIIESAWNWMLTNQHFHPTIESPK